MKELSRFGLGSGPRFDAFTSVISYMQESIFYFVVRQLMANIFPYGVVTFLVYFEKTHSFDSVLY